ncbi:MAG: protein-L-isoaspartate(D-aspartate) O-methyltransferase [Bacteroidota bacterium]
MALTRFESEREEMISLLEERGIKDPNLLRAMRKVDRHLFVTDIFINRSYEDSALPIGCSQTISQPYTVAFMTEALEVQPGNKILEIGTGSGYQAALLSEMGARVFTIERHMTLLEEARHRFDSLGYTIASKAGDGTIGWKEFAPFDGIIVTAGAPSVPPSLQTQLKEGGLLVIPIGDLDIQHLNIIRRRGEMYETKKVEGFKFVPLIGKGAWGKE